MGLTTSLPVALVGLFLAFHLFADARGLGALRAVGKIAASLAFVGLALAPGVQTPFARWVAGGLVFSLAGDVLLLSHRRPAFLAGLGVFLAAHVAYAAAFARAGATPRWVAFPVALALLVVLRWLWSHIGGMRGPVVAYGLAISAMLFFALGVERPEIRLGAVLFFLSDLFVARDRFVAEGLRNRLVGLPLYYSAQLLLALSVR